MHLHIIILPGIPVLCQDTGIPGICAPYTTFVIVSSLYCSNKNSNRSGSPLNPLMPYQTSTALSRVLCALSKSVGIVLGSYKSASVAVGYFLRTSSTSCAASATAFFCASVGVSGHGKLL